MFSQFNVKDILRIVCLTPKDLKRQWLETDVKFHNITASTLKRSWGSHLSSDEDTCLLDKQLQYLMFILFPILYG